MLCNVYLEDEELVRDVLGITIEDTIEKEEYRREEAYKKKEKIEEARRKAENEARVREARRGVEKEARLRPEEEA
ncbi:hypothetical protein TNCV_162691 [Trichonephila clavipes]|nr:hypothetical protein TNCV_162691 [Trichonephila clavipes]